MLKPKENKAGIFNFAGMDGTLDSSFCPEKFSYLTTEHFIFLALCPLKL